MEDKVEMTIKKNKEGYYYINSDRYMYSLSIISLSSILISKLDEIEQLYYTFINTNQEDYCREVDYLLVYIGYVNTLHSMIQIEYDDLETEVTIDMSDKLKYVKDIIANLLESKDLLIKINQLAFLESLVIEEDNFGFEDVQVEENSL